MTEVMSLDVLKLAIANAATAGDDVEFNRLIKEYNGRKAEIAKQLAEAARIESEKLSGVRTEMAEKIGKAIHPAIKKLFTVGDIDTTNEQLEALKATGFYFKFDVVNGYSYGMSVPAVKQSRANVTGTRTSTSAELGMTLDEIYNLHADAEAIENMAVVTTDIEAGTIDAKTGNSRKWAIKNKVKKAAIAAGALTPVK